MFNNLKKKLGMGTSKSKTIQGHFLKLENVRGKWVLSHLYLNPDNSNALEVKIQVTVDHFNMSGKLHSSYKKLIKTVNENPAFSFNKKYADNLIYLICQADSKVEKNKGENKVTNHSSTTNVGDTIKNANMAVKKNNRNGNKNVKSSFGSLAEITNGMTIQGTYIKENHSLKVQGIEELIAIDGKAGGFNNIKDGDTISLNINRFEIQDKEFVIGKAPIRLIQKYQAPKPTPTTSLKETPDEIPGLFKVVMTHYQEEIQEAGAVEVTLMDLKDVQELMTATKADVSNLPEIPAKGTPKRAEVITKRMNMIAPKMFPVGTVLQFSSGFLVSLSPATVATTVEQEEELFEA